MKTNIKKNVDAHGNGSNNQANHETPKKGGKHDANLRKNSFYHFQIGLILAMLMVYAGLEASFAVKGESVVTESEPLVEILEFHPELISYEVEKPKVVKSNATKPVVDPTEFEVVDDNTVVDEEKEFIDIPTDTGEILDIDSIVEVEEKPEIGNIHFSVIEDVPLFPGCEKVAKSERRACFNKKMEKHIRKHFRYPELEQEMGVEGRVNTMFVIDVDGTITNLQLRGPAKGLEKEAARIIGKLPKMIPGKQRGTPVRVPFNLPINFKLSQ